MHAGIVYQDKNTTMCMNGFVAYLYKLMKAFEVHTNTTKIYHNLLSKHCF